MIFKLLKSALSGQECREAQGLDRGAWEIIYKISKEHDLAHIIGYALRSLETKIDEDLGKAFERSANVATFRYMQSAYELESMADTLDKAKICFMPLKGSVLNKYYKEPWLRTSCDIDILVKKEDIEKAKEVLINELGYAFKYASNHDVSLTSPSGVHLELHFELDEDCFKDSKLLGDVWNSGELENTGYHYTMTNELFLFFHIYHMAKHFKGGGCGIKPLLDLWVIRNKMGYDEKKATAMLEREGYLTFYQNALALSNVWFEGATHTELTRQMQAFILQGGVYGTFEQNIAMAQTKESRFKRLFRRIFMPYRQLIVRYPSLKKCPPLYPIYTVIRWFRILFSKDRGRAFDEIKANQSISQNEINQAGDLINKLGL